MNDHLEVAEERLSYPVDPGIPPDGGVMNVTPAEEALLAGDVSGPLERFSFGLDTLLEAVVPAGRSAPQDRTDFLWSVVRLLDSQAERAGGLADRYSDELRDLRRGYEGSEIDEVQIERARAHHDHHSAHADLMGSLRDEAAEKYHHETGERWSRNRRPNAKYDTLHAQAPVIPTGKFVAVTGSPWFADPEAVSTALDKVLAKYPDMVIVHSQAPGAAKAAAAWAAQRGVAAVACPADFGSDDPREAVRRRDAAILDMKPAGIVCFSGHGAPHTSPLLEGAREQGIQIMSVTGRAIDAQSRYEAAAITAAGGKRAFDPDVFNTWESDWTRFRATDHFAERNILGSVQMQHLADRARLLQRDYDLTEEASRSVAEARREARNFPGPERMIGRWHNERERPGANLAREAAALAAWPGYLPSSERRALERHAGRDQGTASNIGGMLRSISELLQNHSELSKAAAGKDLPITKVEGYQEWKDTVAGRVDAVRTIMESSAPEIEDEPLARQRMETLIEDFDSIMAGDRRQASHCAELQAFAADLQQIVAVGREDLSESVSVSHGVTR